MGPNLVFPPRADPDAHRGQRVLVSRGLQVDVNTDQSLRWPPLFTGDAPVATQLVSPDVYGHGDAAQARGYEILAHDKIFASDVVDVQLPPDPIQTLEASAGENQP